MMNSRTTLPILSRPATCALITAWLLMCSSVSAFQSQEDTRPRKAVRQPTGTNPNDARNQTTGGVKPEQDPDLARYGIYEQNAPRAPETESVATKLPLQLQPGDRIAFIGNTLLERSGQFGYLETLLQQAHPQHKLIVRNLCWSADTADLQPRPENFADIEQHLTHENVDVIIAAFGFNESFAGEAGLATFHESTVAFISRLQRRAFNGKSAPRIILLSPIANEDIATVPAGALNNGRLEQYADDVARIADELQVGFVDLFRPTREAMHSPGTDLTINGVHLNDTGYRLLAAEVFEGLFARSAPEPHDAIRREVVDKNRQYFRRYRPLNTFYYTGGRRQSYGYLDFLPAMRNFDIMVSNRDARIHALAAGESVPETVDDSNVPELPETEETRGANEWLSAADELAAFQVDPRFEVTLFAGEEQFPDIAAPIQMRWDSQGRLWVSCSTTYPHVYPGQEPNDKLVVLEDIDGDGRADKSTVFADDLHIPLSFEFGNGGVYVSEMPDLTFIRDTDGDGKADFRERLLTGFGTEDSHHSLHDFIWTPDGDLLFRESIFHHSQVETPYGPVRQQNSGWFQFQPKTHRLVSFGTYPSTNPWGVTFDDWGQHVASHPIYAAAFHSLDPEYPQQHPKPTGLQAYSGTCGQEFVDFRTFPDELQGCFIKVRYKPTNRVEIHRWNEGEYGYTEEYVGDLIFSTNLSFIPVDIRFGPRGDLYICDWYNPVKGHAQYSLRDSRRDRHSGRIWRVTTKDRRLQEPPVIGAADVAGLLKTLERPESRYRYWARRELRERDPAEVQTALTEWLSGLSRSDTRYRHHQVEALWLSRSLNVIHGDLLRDVLSCDDHHARAAAVRLLRTWSSDLPDGNHLLRRACNDGSGIVRMEAAIAASYIGTEEALLALLDVLKYPAEGHLAYAVQCSLGSRQLREHWAKNDSLQIDALLKRMQRSSELKEPTPTAAESEFDKQPGLKTVRIGCMPERMRYTLEQFAVTTGQPVKIVFANPDATDHNLVIVRPGALEEVGMAANEMARDPSNASSDFIPADKHELILHASPMIGPTRKNQVHVLRFVAPDEPGIYPFVCTFPGHWIVMKGDLIVARSLDDVESILAASKPQIVQEWKLNDFADLAAGRLAIDPAEQSVMRGMQAFVKARCNQCHAVSGHGLNLGPDLTKVRERFKGIKLLQQVLEPSSEINTKFQTQQLILKSGRVVTGVVTHEDEQQLHVVANLLTPDVVTMVATKDIDERIASRVSPMPERLADVLTRDEILNLLSFLESGGYQLPEHLKHKHMHMEKKSDHQHGPPAKP